MRVVVVAGIVLLGLAAAGCSGGGHKSQPNGAAASDSPAASATSTVLLAGWNEAIYRGREGPVLSVEVLPEHAVLALDIANIAVFDCRTNCLDDVRDHLKAVRASDVICLYSEANRGVLKLWINRDTCPVLGS
ncbi:MAG: hypothetical protein AB7J35_02800 [Dehalococcoidia bacterium]